MRALQSLALGRGSQKVLNWVNKGSRELSSSGGRDFGEWEAVMWVWLSIRCVLNM